MIQYIHPENGSRTLTPPRPSLHSNVTLKQQLANSSCISEFIGRQTYVHETFFITTHHPFRALDGQVQCNIVISYRKLVYMSSDVEVDESSTCRNSKITRGHHLPVIVNPIWFIKPIWNHDLYRTRWHATQNSFPPGSLQPTGPRSHSAHARSFRGLSDYRGVRS